MADIHQQENAVDEELEAAERWLFFDSFGERAVVLQAAILNEYRRDLVSIVGTSVTRELLYRMGLSMGRHSFDKHRQSITSEDSLWTALKETFERHGWGKVAYHKNLGDTVSVEFQGSALAQGNASNEPHCDILRGALAGWISSFYTTPVSMAVENTCRITGASKCEFNLQLSSSLVDPYSLRATVKE